MPTGVYERSEGQRAAWAKNRLLGTGWNKGLTWDKLPKTKPIRCFQCGATFFVGRDNGRAKFCSRDCKNEASKEKMRQRYRDDPAYRQKMAEWQIRSRFNLTAAEYSVMLDAQGCRCLICDVRQMDVTRKFAVDHDHSTGKIRGLLCAPCNTALGAMKDSPERLRKAALYIEERK